MSNVYAKLGKELFLGTTPTKPTVTPIQVSSRTDTPETAQKTRKISRSRQPERRSVPSTQVKSRVNDQTKPSRLQNVLAIVIRRIGTIKLQEGFFKIKACIQQSNEKEKRLLNFLDKLFRSNIQNNLKHSLFTLVYSTNNVPAKQFPKLESKNQKARKSVQLIIAKQPITRQLEIGFSLLKRFFGKKEKTDVSKATRVFLNVLSRVVNNSLILPFQTLNKILKRSINLKFKPLLKTLFRIVKSKQLTGFNSIILSASSNRQGVSQLKNTKPGSSREKPGSTRQSSINKKSHSSNQSNIEVQISQQKMLKIKHSQTLRQVDLFVITQQGMKSSIEEQATKQERILANIELKKSQLETSIQIKPTDDKIRVHPDDPIFFEKVKSLYLQLKHVDGNILHKSQFIKDNSLDFKSLLQNPQYLLALNKKLKDQVRRVEDFLAPSDSTQSRPHPKIFKEINQMKKELVKENDLLKKSVQRYVKGSYDTEWLFNEAKRLQNEMDNQLEVLNQ